MRHKIIKSTIFFQDLFSSYFRRMRQQIIETLLLLCVCHLFGLYNPNQVADALKLPKARLYRNLTGISQIYQGGNNNQEIAGVAK